MSMVYAFRCDSCGVVSYHLPEEWTCVEQTRHYCDDVGCRYAARKARETSVKFKTLC